MSKKITYDIDVNTNKVDKASDSIDKLGKSAEKNVGGLSEKIDGIGEKFGSLPGPVGDAAKSVSGLGKQFLQLLANPVVLVITGIVGAFKLLYDALKSTGDGQDRLNKITEIWGSIIKPVFKVIQDVAIFLADKVIVVLEALGEMFGANSKAASDLADNIKKVNDESERMTIDKARQNRDLLETKEILNDTTKSYKERKDALDKVEESEKQLGFRQLRNAKQNIKNIEEQLKADKDNVELKNKLNEAYVELFGIQTELSTKAIFYSKEGKRLDNEEIGRIKQKNAEEAAAAKERKARNDEYLKERIEQAKKIRDLENKIRLDSITNDRDKAIEQLKIQYRNDTEEINQSKATEQEKAKQKKLIEEKYRKDYQKIYKDAAEKDDQEYKALIQKLDSEEKERQKQDEEKINKKYEKSKLDKSKRIKDEKEYQAALAQDEKNRLYDLLVYRKSVGLDTLEIEQKIADFRKEENKRKLEEEINLAKQKKENLQSNLDVTKQVFGNIQGLLKENSKGATALAIGQAVIDTYVAANKALASAPPPLNFALMGTVIATGIANIKKISEQASKMGVDTGGGASVSTGPSIGVVGGQVDSSTQMAKSLQGAVGGPQKAYVVGNDVTSRQSLDRRISQNATLGG